MQPTQRAQDTPSSALGPNVGLRVPTSTVLGSAENCLRSGIPWQELDFIALFTTSAYLFLIITGSAMKVVDIREV